VEFLTLANKYSVSLVKDIPMHLFKVNRGKSRILIETLRADWEGMYGENKKIAIQYFSVTYSGAARDKMLRHSRLRQEDRFLVVQDEIVVAVVDSRQDLEALGFLNLFHMKVDADLCILLIPKGALHGFLVFSDTPAILLNFPTCLYDVSDEQHMPYDRFRIKDFDVSMFSWDRVREKFSLKHASNEKS